MQGLARLSIVVLVVTLGAALIAPTLVVGGQPDQVTTAKKKKKKKKKFRVTAEGEVVHGMGQSDVEVDVTVRRKGGGGPVKGATVSGELTEVPADGSAHVSAVLVGKDSAKTDGSGGAGLTFTIDSYGEKKVTLTVKKKGYKTFKKSYLFEVTADDGPVFP